MNGRGHRGKNERTARRPVRRARASERTSDARDKRRKRKRGKGRSGLVSTVEKRASRVNLGCQSTADRLCRCIAIVTRAIRKRCYNQSQARAIFRRTNRRRVSGGYKRGAITAFALFFVQRARSARDLRVVGASTECRLRTAERRNRRLLVKRARKCDRKGRSTMREMGGERKTGSTWEIRKERDAIGDYRRGRLDRGAKSRRDEGGEREKGR